MLNRIENLVRAGFTLVLMSLLIACGGTQDSEPDEPVVKVECQAVGHDKKIEVRLRWDKPDGKIQGYKIYRAQGLSDEWLPLIAEPIKPTHFDDQTVVNGSGYRYRVEAIPKIDQTNPDATPFLICEQEPQVFIALNLSQFAHCEAALDEDGNARLDWALDTASRVRVEHKYKPREGQGEYQQIAETEHAQPTGFWLHDAPVYGTRNDYRVTSLQDFENPFTGEHFSLAGDHCDKHLALNNALEIDFDNAEWLDDNLALIYVSPGEQATVTGQIRQAAGEVELTWRSHKPNQPKHTLEAQVAGGAFSQTLPHFADTVEWKLQARDTGAARNQQRLFLRLQSLKLPPGALDERVHGWQWRAYAAGSDLQQLDQLDPSSDTPLAALPQPPNDAAVYRAQSWLQINQAGRHCFAVQSARQMQLHLAGLRVFHFKASNEQIQSGQICAELQVGFYPLDLRFAGGDQAAHLRLFWVAPNRVWEPLAEQFLWRDKTALDHADADADGYPDRYDVFPANPDEWSDRDGDGLGDHADTDRDGDGRENLLDLYPDDPVLAPGEALYPVEASLSPATRQLRLRWHPPEDATSYRIFRTDLDGANATLLASPAQTETEFTLDDIDNGAAYRIGIVWVSSEPRKAPLAYHPLEIWTAWNDQPIVSCEASRVVEGLALSWLPSEPRVRIARQVADQAWTAFGEHQSGSLSDSTVRHNGVYRYRFTSLQTRRNPFRRLDIELPAASDCFTTAQAVTSELAVNLEDLVQTAPGAYEKRPAEAGDYLLRGAISHALGPVRVIAEAGDQRLEIAPSDARFSLPLRLNPAHSVWQLMVIETEAITPHSWQAQLTFVLDTEAPNITLDILQPWLTWQEQVSISGQISDALSGVQRLWLRRHGDPAEQDLGFDAEGRFTTDLALLNGANGFDLLARDLAGNTATASFHIERDSNLPALTILEPTPGLQTYDASISVSGSLTWRHTADLLTVSINGQAAAVGNNLSFGPVEVALAEGVNTLHVVVQSPVGNVSRDLSVERLVDRQAPTITLEPLAEPVTREAFAIVNGRIVDDRSGVARAWLTHDRAPGEQAIPLDQEGYFGIQAPLEIGANRVTVQAEDGQGNRANANLLITRDEGRPSLQISTPHQGMLTDQTQIDFRAEIVYLGAASDLQLSVNGLAAVISADSQANHYRAELSGIALNEGVNELLIRLRFPNGVIEESRRVTLDAEAANANDTPPALTLRRPLDGAVLASQGGELELSLLASARPVALTINGETVSDIDWLDERNARATWAFSFDAADSFTAEIRLRDSKNREVSLTVTYHRDTEPPQILVDRLLPEPALNESPDNPLRVTGSIRDPRLAAVTLNGQPLTLQPGELPGEHRFALNLSLLPGVEQLLSFSARDSAGNETHASYRVAASSQGGLVILLPALNAEFISEAASFVLNVTVQVEGDPDSTSLHARVDQGDWVALNRQGRFAQGSVEFPSAAGAHDVVVELRGDDGRVLARATRSFRLRLKADIPLAVLATQPENGARDIEPNEFIAVHFNQAIDPSKFSMSVLETAHGLSYQNLDSLGVDFTQAKGAQLVEISRSREPAPGSVVFLPGHSSVAFYPSRDLAYDGEVYVDVSYDGQILVRFSYRTRPLPTFIGGLLLDPLGQPIPGIEVSLPELKRHAVSNNDGAFSFGFGDSAAEALPAGRYQLVINPGNKDPRHASVQQWISIQQGRLSDLGSITVQRMNPDVAYRLLESGNANASLAEGELRLDLSQASLLFPDGARSGAVHAQFLAFHELGKAFTPHAVPQWSYSLQPVGIQVQGELGLSVNMPKLNGSHDYLLEQSLYVVLIGVDQDGNALVPVGVGYLQDAVVRSVGVLHLKRLDHIGMAFVDYALQASLQAYAEGQMSWDALLSALIQAAEAGQVAPAP